MAGLFPPMCMIVPSFFFIKRIKQYCISSNFEPGRYHDFFFLIRDRVRNFTIFLFPVAGGTLYRPACYCILLQQSGFTMVIIATTCLCLCCTCFDITELFDMKYDQSQQSNYEQTFVIVMLESCFVGSEHVFLTDIVLSKSSWCYSGQLYHNILFYTI